jgi:hypothetical protein
VIGVLYVAGRPPSCCIPDGLGRRLRADLPADLAEFMADSQLPSSVDALGEQVTDPAWRTKPNWYMVTTEDRMIPPPAQRTMSQRAGSTVAEVAASHSVYLSQATAVADLIKQAASALTAQH